MTPPSCASARSAVGSTTYCPSHSRSTAWSRSCVMSWRSSARGRRYETPHNSSHKAPALTTLGLVVPTPPIARSDELQNLAYLSCGWQCAAHFLTPCHTISQVCEHLDHPSLLGRFLLLQHDIFGIGRSTR